MDKQQWTNSDIRKLFKMEKKYKSIQTLYNAEDRGDIPKATRVQRGKVSTRVWSLEQIPEIGKKFGFLPVSCKQHRISKFVPKGGVAKTSTSYNEAKTFALNGHRVLIIGLDSELSITDIVAPHAEPTRLDDIKPSLGLYHFFCENAPLADIIQPTSLPTLDIIPETHDLALLEKWIDRQKRREYIFRDKLLPNLQDYDIVIFDNCPYWNHLVTNSIVCSETLLVPLGCNLLAFNSSSSNIQNIFDFQDEMNLHSQNIIMFSTMLERSSLSQQINATYLNRYSEYIVTTPIRKSVKWEEALMKQQTILEYAPTTPFADDYYDVICDIWRRITKEENIQSSESFPVLEEA